MNRFGLHLGAGLLALAAALPLAAPAAQGAALDDTFKALSAYDWGQDRSALDQIDKTLNATAGDAAARKDMEARLIALLGSKATRAAKDFACRKLWQTGSPESVPALAALLTDANLSHMARYALERMPFPAAGKALRDALPKTAGLLKVGVINSIGMREDAEAVPALVPLLGDADPEIAAAAAVALGRAGTPEAAAALAGFRAKAPKALQPVAVDASLDAAQRLVRNGNRDEAAKICEELQAPSQPAYVRLAAFQGMVAARPAEAAPTLVKALAGADPLLRTQAAQLIAEVPGEEATKTFAAALSGLPPAGQVALLAALGTRGDAAARPAILQAVGSKDAQVRAAALAALATTGSAADVPLLLGIAASADKEAAAAAQASLARLKGGDVNTAIVAALGGQPTPAVRAEVVRCLAARGARGLVGTVVQCVGDPDASVRAAAFEALVDLGGPEQTAAVVKALGAAKDPAERAAAERALLAIASRARAASADAILAGLDGADAPSRLVLLRALGRAGGANALAAVRAAVADKDAQVQDAAVRVLSDWPDLAAAQPLLELAKTAPKPNHQILALRGYVRLVDLQAGNDAKMKMLTEAAALAKRPEEKKLLLGALAGVPTPEALRRVVPDLDDPALVEEACAAAVNIAKGTARGDAALTRQALEKVLAKTKNRKTRQDAQKILGGLKK